MRRGQTLRASDGYEVALFPLSYLYMSQDEGGDYSHEGTYNIDFLGYSSSGRIYDAPIYAPCTCKVVYIENTYASGNMRVFQSVNKVHTPAGLQYIHFYFCHDKTPVATYVGQIFNQGAICSHTGTYGNVTGDHTHSCMASGVWTNWSTNITTRDTGHQDLTYRIHYWNAVYVNDTVIKRGYNHNWRIWDEEPPTPVHTPIKNKFPWVLYASKFRNIRS